MKKTLSLVIPALCLAASQSIWADIVYVCEHSDAVRKITVAYEQAGAQVPCAVTYEKAEGVQTLWTAQAQEGYCEEKAAAFVEKQRGWGWTCDEAGAQAEAEPEAEPVAEETESESMTDDAETGAGGE